MCVTSGIVSIPRSKSTKAVDQFIMVNIMTSNLASKLDKLGLLLSLSYY